MIDALPDGLTTRPLERSESRALFDLIAAREQHDIGSVDIEEADLISDWALPGYDLEASSIGVYADEQLVAYAEHMRGDRVDAAVHPDHRGRGIGTWLAARLRQHAKSRGATLIGMPVPEGSAGDRLLATLGYRIRWTSWVPALPEGAEIEHRDLPDGYAVGEARPDQLVAMHDVLEDAFLEWSERDRETFEAFTAQVLQRPGYESWSSRVVTDSSGAVAAAAIVFLSENGTAYISGLGTRKDQRNRGLAQALLVDSFAAGREHGATVSELSTDSRTGALGLYEKVGMVTTSVWVNRCIDLTPAG
ncbi:GNAT family N-acetyltransferase [Nocardioides sp. B-3]|uniref:GNAT family N-acetyltransferase n=1 Tax=Nocardioides sp. B-3 TaxID=2895565 RepID=UPI00215297E8|nr:GNAT family N-acetyltransferase [Nocardioides sp. B-3]UUZ61205.1 GNAT family N-acetyltransferase [Nocardioides sp. B-3]